MNDALSCTVEEGGYLRLFVTETDGTDSEPIDLLEEFGPTRLAALLSAGRAAERESPSADREEAVAFGRLEFEGVAFWEGGEAVAEETAGQWLARAVVDAVRYAVALEGAGGPTPRGTDGPEDGV